MNPDDTRSIAVPKRDEPQTTQKPDRDLAVALMRQQINQLYDHPGDTTAQQQSQPLEPVYDKTHDETSVHDVNNDQWQRYHTAWQQYYQQYYERYYLAQVHAREQRHLAKDSLAAVRHPTKTAAEFLSAEESISKDKALHEIRTDLRTKIKEQTHRMRKSRHFFPILSALSVMMLFLFLQFNELITAQVKYYLSPGSINPQNIILDPSIDIKVGQEPKIIIPKINVDAPVVYDVPTPDEAPVQAGLHRGVVHYNIPGASAIPGQKGNAVFLGHSSGSVFNDNAYKFIFVQLEQMVVGDKFYLNYAGTRYTYIVTSTETILPTQVSKLITNNSKPTASLVTCTPVGTNYKRFVVHADQISPDPNGATQGASSNTSTAPSTITGTPPSLFERLFGF
ncbi:class E sortase [Candidatus Saccharibacteria bacterium]|nr:class E sortase [Candidatus Saccharibacteria bacterium]